jgi:phosphate transport system substrate-binding protein
MKRAHRRFRVSIPLAALVLLVVAAPALASTTINGAGATFPYPIYYQWEKMYASVTHGAVKVNYQGIGSGGGINAIESGVVMFGATDAPLKTSDLSSHSLVQFPMVVGGVVPVVHISGIGAGALKLTGPVLAQIYKGTIKYWNDSRITSLNPSVKSKLKHAAIVVVHRSDASGTTWIYTHYLKAVYSSWPFADKSGSWPVGIGGKGNDGVAGLVQQHNNSIGYVEFAYAKSNHIAYAQLKNRSGRWVLPSLSSFGAALSGTGWSASNGFVTLLVNRSGTGVWPITGSTFILVKKSTGNYAAAHAMFGYFNWCYKNSSARSAATKLIYVNMPTSVASKVEAVWHAQVKAGGKAAW